MKRTMMMGAIVALLSGCESFDQPIALAPYGDAMRHNMAAQIVPSLPSYQPPATDAARQSLAFTRYRLDATAPLQSVSTTTVVPAAPAAPALPPVQ